MGMASERGLCVVFVAVVAAVAASGCSGSRERGGENASPEEPPYQRLLRTLASDGTSGAVAVVGSPKGIWRGAAGWADSNARRRARPSDRFAVEGVTQTFVAAVLLQLVQERRLSLQDTVQRWLPGLMRPRPKITVRELVKHTSGLPVDLNAGRPLKEHVEAIAAIGVVDEPGRSIVISYANYVLLGLIVERVTGRRLERVVADRIFRPLHLESTSYGTERAKRISPWLGYPEFLPAAGEIGIVSTADDIATFFRALMSGKVIGRELLSQMTQTVAAGARNRRGGLGIVPRYQLSCGEAWGGGSDLSYSIDIRVARDGSKAVVARNNPTIDPDRVIEKMYCPVPKAVRR
jgi:D-alanyl-D-alanine carboxypeptidase